MDRKQVIVVIDGQGGRIGKLIVEELKRKIPKAEVIAVGTNSTATAAMLKGGADDGATGENSVVVASRRADFIIGPVGILAADSMIGEVTEKMAAAVGRSAAKKVLIPVNRCQITVAGVTGKSPAQFVPEAVEIVRRAVNGEINDNETE